MKRILDDKEKDFNRAMLFVTNFKSYTSSMFREQINNVLRKPETKKHQADYTSDMVSYIIG